MGMTIDKAIKQLETYSIPCGKYKEAYDFAIDTMRKYQKIVEIFNYITDVGYSNDYLYDKISEVIEDGNVD